MTKLSIAIVALAGVLGLSACSTASQRAVAPINPELMNLAKEEIWDRAESLFEQKKWPAARSHFSFIYENYPNDPLGRRSLLRVADTYYEQGGLTNLVEAQYKYRDFINRYPGSEQADYAMLQIANVSFRQMEPAYNDQSKTYEAITKYQEMIAAFPNSALRPQAEEKIRAAKDRLAQHEHQVASFYMMRGAWNAAVSRLNTIVDQYPDYTARDKTFYDLGLALDSLGRDGEARLYFERVIAEFPDSEYASMARGRMGELQS